MKFTLKRTLTTGVLALGLAAGSIAAAAPASAAPRFQPVVEQIRVHNHVDTIVYKPASKKEFTGIGKDSGIATYYDIKIKHGKKVLFTKKHVNAWRVLYTDLKVYDLGSATFKTDKALVKKASVATKVSTAHAKKVVLRYLKSQGYDPSPAAQRKSETQAAVNSVVTTVQVDIVESGTFTAGRQNFDDGIYVITTKTGTDEYGEIFTVKGYDPKDNYTYTYDSNTGTFKDGKIK